MDCRGVSFFADRQRLAGDLYLPDGASADDDGTGAADGALPGIVACSGYQGLKDIHPARFARALVPAGFACLAFDYRGFGFSDGERGRLVPQEQVEDVRAAVSCLRAVAEVDEDRIGVIGWGLGGGVVVVAAASDQRIGAVVSCNGIADGERSTRAMHDDASWQRLLARIRADREHRALRGPSEIVHPFDIVRLDLDTATRGYVDAELYQTPGFGSGVSLEAADYLLRFHPERFVDRITPRPLLLVHGADNRFHRPAESRALHARAGQPCHLEILEGAGHTEWMHDDHPIFQRLAGLLRDFFGEHLDAARSGARP